jgi:putative isomerase
MAVGTSQPSSKASPNEFDELRRYLLAQTQGCVHPPMHRFQHPWLSPMPSPPVPTAIKDLGESVDDPLLRPPRDYFTLGDYSLGLFHHDASESCIELMRYPEFREAALGSLLCLLDCAGPSGRIHRVELAERTRDTEPSKPVIAQYALRAVDALGRGGAEWAERHQVLARVVRFLQFLEAEYVGPHGLFLTHSSRQSGFDSDILTAGTPDKSVEGPDTNAFMVLEYRAVAELHRRLGQDGLAATWEEKADALCSRIQHLLWFEGEHGPLYVALRCRPGVPAWRLELVATLERDGTPRPFQTWVSLLPLYAGIPNRDQAERLAKVLTDPKTYWGPWGVRTTPANDVYFNQAPRVMLYDFKRNDRGPVSNWSGPIWVLSNYYLAEGLARYGFQSEARELSLKTARLLARGLEREGALRECYDDSGQGLWPQKGTFISWSVLALTLLRRHCPELTQSWASAQP